jgi:hypothetical protein
VDPHGLAFRPVGSTSAVTAVLGQTTANLLGPVVTTGTASVTNVLARVAATTTSRKQLIPTTVTTIPGSASSADSSEDESSEDPGDPNSDSRVPDRIVGDVVSAQTLDLEGTQELPTYFGAPTPSCTPEEWENARLKQIVGQGMINIGHFEVAAGTAAVAAGFALLASGVGSLGGIAFIASGALRIGVGYAHVAEGARLMQEGFAEEQRCGWWASRPGI